MKVKDIMTSNVATCSPDASLSEIARLMRDKDCGAIPVVDAGKLQGIITDRDIVIRCIAEGKNLMDQSARSCMTTHVASIKESASLSDVTTLMEKEQIRRVVVTDGNDHITGIVAQADVALNAPRKETGDVVQKVSK